MSIDWAPLERELKIWRQERIALPLWWRDDDAVAHTSALDRMATLARDLGMPVHIAVIPKHADATLVDACKRVPELIPLVHGWAHENHAMQGAKKAEFGTMCSARLGEAARALDRMKLLFGTDFLEVFVPPWNRIDTQMIRALPDLGYKALSTFTPRRAPRPVPGLLQVNTHIDPINWRGGGGLTPPNVLLSGLVQHLQDRRAGVADANEPLGILTHHLVHDAALWDFTKTCLGRLLDQAAMPVNPFISKDKKS